MKPTFLLLNKQRYSKKGFTLLQILLVMAIIALLSAFLFGVFGKSRAAAQRAKCDVQLKAITMALDAFRQDTGHYPSQLSDLINKKYLMDASILKCPSDPRKSGSYDEYYVMRAGRDSGELPILGCPLCETDSGQAIQGFKGRYTKHFATRPAELTAATSTTIERAGKKPISGRIGMQLRGGDIIRTENDGQAVVRFADGSQSTMGGGSQITVLQSFISGHMRAPLYTLIKQTAGEVHYRVNHGSKFDVTTPTATAGALGTEFNIKCDNTGAWWLKVIESKVYVTNLDERVIVTPSNQQANTQQTNMARTSETQEDSPVIVTTNWVAVGQEGSQEATPTPGAANSTPTATSAPTSSKTGTSKKCKKRFGHGRLNR